MDIILLVFIDAELIDLEVHLVELFGCASNDHTTVGVAGSGGKRRVTYKLSWTLGCVAQAIAVRNLNPGKYLRAW